MQPLTEIGTIARAHGITLHTDAVQAGGQLNLSVDRLKVDLLALSAHKFYGPKGVGVLYVRSGTELISALTGGGHERGRRPGTVNVAEIVGLATALKLAQERRESENARVAVSQGTVIFDIADVSKVWIMFDAYERDLQFIRNGDRISFNLQALPGKNYSGKIIFIDPVIDPVTRVAKVRVEVNNNAGKLKPGNVCNRYCFFIC